MVQKNKVISITEGIRIINAKLGRDTTTAVSQLQWSQSLKTLKKEQDEATYGD